VIQALFDNKSEATAENPIGKYYNTIEQ